MSLHPRVEPNDIRYFGSYLFVPEKCKTPEKCPALAERLDGGGYSTGIYVCLDSRIKGSIENCPGEKTRAEAKERMAKEQERKALDEWFAKFKKMQEMAWLNRKSVMLNSKCTYPECDLKCKSVCKKDAIIVGKNNKLYVNTKVCDLCYACTKICNQR